MSIPVVSSVTGMLHLEPAVDLDERRRTVRAEQELERAGIDVSELPAGPLDRCLHRLARLGREGGRRRLLDQLLVSPLDRALALTQREHSALAVAQHLDLDVPRRHEARSRYSDPSPNAASASALAAPYAASSSSGASTRRMPLPPPPAVAFSSTGNRARAAARGSLRGSHALVPGTSGRRRHASRPCARLVPVFSITSAGGPMKTRSFSAQARTNAAFSDRNRSPGGPPRSRLSRPRRSRSGCCR